MRMLAAAVFLGIAWAGATLGATALGAEVDACSAVHRGCLAQCERDYPMRHDDMGRAGCQARCSWEGAACAAQGALDETRTTLDRDLRPWLADQAGKWQRFLDGFRNGPGRPEERPRSPDPAPGTSL